MTSSSSQPSLFSIAYYVPPAKFEEIDFQDFINLCHEENIKVTELNNEFFDKYMYEKHMAPSFNLILHTLSDIYCENVDPSWLRLLEYIRMQNSKTIITDPIDKISPLLDRYEQYSILTKAANKETLFHVPSYLRVLDENSNDIVQALSQLNITFPIICKPLKCDAPLKSHYHKIIFDAKHLEECERPCILQQFIEHDALLFKVNIIGNEKFQIVQRKSIRNLTDEQTKDAIAFNSIEVSGEDGDHELSKQTEQTLTSSKPIDEIHLHRIAQAIREEFQLSLLSIDVLRMSNTDTYAVIDVNYFPCYNGMPNPSKYIFQMCKSKLNSTSSD